MNRLRAGRNESGERRGVIPMVSRFHIVDLTLRVRQAAKRGLWHSSLREVTATLIANRVPLGVSPPVRRTFTGKLTHAARQLLCEIREIHS